MFHVGDVVRKLREQRHWKIQRLADEAAVHKATVSAIERGQHYRSDTLQQIAHAFGLTAMRLETLLLEWAAQIARPAEVSERGLTVARMFDQVRDRHVQGLVEAGLEAIVAAQGTDGSSSAGPGPKETAAPPAAATRAGGKAKRHA